MASSRCSCFLLAKCTFFHRLSHDVTLIAAKRLASGSLRPPTCQPPHGRRRPALDSKRRSLVCTALRPLSLCSSLSSWRPRVPASAQSDLAGKNFGEVTRGSTIGTGLFTIYYKHDDILLSLSPSQFDRDYLLVTQVAQGIGELGLDGGTTLRSDLVRFHREGDRVELWVVNPHMAAAPGTPMARTVSYSFGHSVAQSFPIASERREGQVLIDITPFFLSDWADVETALQNAAAQRKINATISLDDKRSSFQQLRLYPTNVEAEVRLTFESSRNLGLETVSDYRWIPLGIHYSLIELPAAPMRPRYADDRVGYFVSAIKDFSRDTADELLRALHQSLASGKEVSVGGHERAGSADHVLHRPHRAGGMALLRAGRESSSGTARSKRPAIATPFGCWMPPQTAHGARRMLATRPCAGPRPITRSTRWVPPASIRGPVRSSTPM